MGEEITKEKGEIYMTRLRVEANWYKTESRTTFLIGLTQDIFVRFSSVVYIGHKHEQ